MESPKYFEVELKYFEVELTLRTKVVRAESRSEAIIAVSKRFGLDEDDIIEVKAIEVTLGGGRVVKDIR
jgi:hypothetical protein